jgi:hypothetical protein
LELLRRAAELAEAELVKEGSRDLTSRHALKECVKVGGARCESGIGC